MGGSSPHFVGMTCTSCKDTWCITQVLDFKLLFKVTEVNQGVNHAFPTNQFRMLWSSIFLSSMKAAFDIWPDLVHHLATRGRKRKAQSVDYALNNVWIVTKFCGCTSSKDTHHNTRVTWYAFLVNNYRSSKQCWSEHAWLDFQFWP
jgi:hypothetical protein